LADANALLARSGSNVSLDVWTRQLCVRIGKGEHVPHDSIATFMSNLHVPDDRVIKTISVLPPTSTSVVPVPLSDVGFLPGDAVEFKTCRKVTKLPTRETRADSKYGFQRSNSRWTLVEDGSMGVLMGQAAKISNRTVVVYVSVNGVFGWTTLSSLKKIET